MERTSKRQGLIAGLVFFAALAIPASAAALPGPQGRLTQLSGLDGCVSEDGSDNNGNSDLCEDGDALFNAFRIAVAPDGENVYTAASDATPGAVGIFNRDGGGGDLDQPAGAAGCVGTSPCTPFTPLDSARGVAVSPDGQNVYATAAGSDAVVSMKRLADGSLIPLGDPGGTGGGRSDDCIALNPGNPASSAGCGDGKAISDPIDIAVSPDGEHVYVTATSGSASGSGSVAVFSRETSGPLAGKLTQIGTSADPDGGCVSSDGASEVDADSCTDAEGGFALNSAQGLDVSDDGNQVYVAASAGNGINVFDRDAGTGALDHVQCALAVVDGLFCSSTSKGVAGAVDVDVAPDGRHVYSTSGVHDALARFTRSATTGLLTAANDCVSEGATPANCSVTTGRALDEPRGVRVSPDNKTVYVATSSNAIATFSRNIASGETDQLNGAGGCVADQPGSPAGTATCADGRALIGADDVALSPNGLHVYATTLTSRSVTAYARQLPPQCAGGAVPGTRGPETSTIQLNCPDPNGDPISGYFVNDPPQGSLAGLNIPAGTVQLTPDPGYDGPDSFQLNAQDNAPETGQAVTVALDVDTVAPGVTISSAPTEPTTNATPAFGFESEDGATFECRFDGAPFAPCDDSTGPSGSHTPAAPLRVGAHVFEVRATDAVGNAGEKATQPFSVVAQSTPPQDLDPPETTISKTKVKGDDATVRFSSDEPGSTFQCRVDKKPLKPCTSPRKLKNLDDGKHKFFVQATDAAGNTDPSAAKSKFEVES